jgi:quercetin dioxygenase-like cupin family protein
MYEDERGTIQDVLTEPIDSVTRIFTKKGAVRGNHVHKHTAQWTYVLSGKLFVVGTTARIVEPGEMVVDGPGVPHAWKAFEDTDCWVFTRGPRSGENYESDTERLETPLIT